MSKSASTPKGLINLLNKPKTTAKKVKSAVTDTDTVIRYDSEHKPGISNLLTAYSTLAGTGIAELEENYAGKGYGALKTDLAEVMVDFVTPFRERTQQYLDDPETLNSILAKGAEKARAVAAETLAQAYDRVGFLPAKHSGVRPHTRTTGQSAAHHYGCACPPHSHSLTVDSRTAEYEPDNAPGDAKDNATGDATDDAPDTTNRRRRRAGHRSACRSRSRPYGSLLQERRAGFGDPAACGIPTHVTLLPPTEVHAADLPAVEAHLTEVAVAGRPFPMRLSGTGTFRPLSPVVFVKVVQGAEACAWLRPRVRDASGPVARELQLPVRPHVAGGARRREQRGDGPRVPGTSPTTTPSGPARGSRSTNRAPTVCGASSGSSPSVDPWCTRRRAAPDVERGTIASR